MRNEWECVERDVPDMETLDALFDNEIAAIRIPGFVEPDTLSAAVRGVRAHGMQYYRDVDPPIGKIGITQFEHRNLEIDRRAYFELSGPANEERKAVFAESGDLLELVLEELNRHCDLPVEQAREPTGEQYFAGLVRIINETLLHCDWAGLDAPGWAIGDIDAQLTWNIYCSLPTSGGRTVVFDRPWDAMAERHLIDGSYGYDPELVTDARAVRLEPRAGELLLFNSRNFHRVEQCSGSQDRISVTSFIGRVPGSRLIAWS